MCPSYILGNVTLHYFVTQLELHFPFIKSQFLWSRMKQLLNNQCQYRLTKKKPSKGPLYSPQNVRRFNLSHFLHAVWVNRPVPTSTCFRLLEKWTFPEKSVTSDLCRAGRGCQQANALLCGQLPFNPIIVTRQLLAMQNLVSGNSS